MQPHTLYRGMPAVHHQAFGVAPVALAITLLLALAATLVVLRWRAAVTSAAGIITALAIFGAAAGTATAASAAPAHPVSQVYYHT